MAGSGAKVLTHTVRMASHEFARACIGHVGGGDDPCLQWSSDGLIVKRRGRIGLVREPRDWLAPRGFGLLRGERPVAAGVVGASAALVDAVLATQEGADSEPVVCDPDAMLGHTTRTGSGRPGGLGRGEWQGYVALDEGLLGVVIVGSHAHAAWDTAVTQVGLRKLERTRAAAVLQQLGIPALPVSVGQASRGSVVPAVDAPGLTELNAPRELTEMSAPRMREDRAEVEGFVTGRTVPGRTILDLGRVVAAPFAADLLERLGVAVMRVRPPGRQAQASGARVLDLAHRDEQMEIARLIESADLVVENFRPRGWTAVADVCGSPRERVAIRGFSESSPLCNWKVYGFLLEAFFGIGRALHDQSGRATSVALWDKVTGVVAAAACVRRLEVRPIGADDRAVTVVAQSELAKMLLVAYHRGMVTDG
jgi:hypothetical protein